MKNFLAKLKYLSAHANLAHAWLLQDQDLETLLVQIDDFCQWLLCTDKQGSDQACKLCKSCKLFYAGTHPDFYKISPTSQGSILVEDLRALNEFLVAKAQFSAQKAIVISEAEKMNKQAANSLLKNLEEPKGDTVFFLLTTNIDLLLPTVVSRCQIIKFLAPKDMAIANSSELGSYIKDLETFLTNKGLTTLQLIDKWLKHEQNQVLYWLELALAELLRTRYKDSRLWTMLDKVQQARSWFAVNYNPNLQLVLEDILLE